MTDHHVDPSREAFDAFKDLPRDQPVEMLNLVRFRERAEYPLDHPYSTEDLSGAEAYRHYSKASGPVFARIGGSILWSASPQLMLIGPVDELWDVAFVARYPNASSFLALVTDDEYRVAVVHRQAAVLTSRLIRTAPRDAPSVSFG